LFKDPVPERRGKGIAASSSQSPLRQSIRRETAYRQDGKKNEKRKRREEASHYEIKHCVTKEKRPGLLRQKVGGERFLA